MLKRAYSNGSNAARDSYACKSGTIIKSIIFNGSNPVRDSVAAGFPAWTIYKCCFIFIKQYAAFRAKGRIAAVNSYVCKSGTILKNIIFDGSNAARDSYAFKSGTTSKSKISNGNNAVRDSYACKSGTIKKAISPMEVRPLGIVMLVRLEQ